MSTGRTTRSAARDPKRMITESHRPIPIPNADSAEFHPISDEKITLIQWYAVNRSACQHDPETSNTMVWSRCSCPRHDQHLVQYIPDNEVAALIDHLQFSYPSKSKNRNPAYFWLEGLREYERFLEIILNDVPEFQPRFHPLPLIELIWRSHILDTKGYRQLICSVSNSDKIELEYNPYLNESEKSARYRAMYPNLTEGSKTLPIWWPRLDSHLQLKSSGLMKLFVKTLTGKTRVIDVPPNALVTELLQSVEDVEGIPVELQRLIFAGRQLEWGRTIASYSIQKEATLQLVLRLRGC